jgi:alkylmercury lyase
MFGGNPPVCRFSPTMSPQYTIGELSRAAGVPASTVRYYENRGLLTPEGRSESNHRLYGRESLRRLRFIRAAQTSGFTLEDIGTLLELQGGSVNPCDEVQAILERRLGKVEEQLEHLSRVRGVLNDSIRWCREPNGEGCCQVIDDLFSAAGSDANLAPTETDSALPRTPDEIAGALLRGLRPYLRDVRLYVVAKRLLANARPIAPQEIADLLDEPVQVVLETLEQVPRIERDEKNNLVGWGLTMRPTPHHFDVDGKKLYTWCAFDTLFFPALLGRTVTVRSTCPASGVDIRVIVRPDGIQDLDPATAMVSIVLPDSTATQADVRGAFCDQVHYLRDAEATTSWLEGHRGGIVLPVEGAFEVGRILSQRLLVEAGEP